MMRSLWTAASGMIGQQTALDVTANNLSNVNTTAVLFQSVIWWMMNSIIRSIRSRLRLW